MLACHILLHHPACQIAVPQVRSCMRCMRRCCLVGGKIDFEGSVNNCCWLDQKMTFCASTTLLLIGSVTI